VIYDFLMFNKPLAYAGLVLAILVCAGLGYGLLRAGERGQRVSWVLAGLAVLPVLGLTLVPDFKGGELGPVQCAIQFGVPRLNILELANMALLFVPVFFAALAWRRPVAALLAGSGLSVLVETIQALVPALHRACDTDDWVINTLGAAAGALAALALIAIARRRNAVGRSSETASTTLRD
jgi:hypothetical protein